MEEKIKKILEVANRFNNSTYTIGDFLRRPVPETPAAGSLHYYELGTVKALEDALIALKRAALRGYSPEDPTYHMVLHQWQLIRDGVVANGMEFFDRIVL